MKYLHARRAGARRLPAGARRRSARQLPVPALDAFAQVCSRARSGREQSTTMVFVQLLVAAAARSRPRQAHRADRRRRGAHLRHAVAVPPGRDLFVGRAALRAGGQRRAALLQGGARTARSSRKASPRPAPFRPGSPPRRATARTACRCCRSTSSTRCFGFQRVGDLVWAAADSRARGFLLGATAGRTTLSGEGLQHQDGSSHLLVSTVPNCVAYDPCFGYELAVIMQDGMRRMLENAGRRVLLRHGDERELRASRRCRRARRKESCAGMYRFARHEEPGARARAGSKRRSAAPRLGHDPARSARRRRAAGAGLERRAPTSGASRASPSCAATASSVERWNRLHPGRRRQRSPGSSTASRPTAGPVDRRERLRARASPI